MLDYFPLANVLLCLVGWFVSTEKGKSHRADNIPAELVQAGGETITDVLTEVCNKIWRKEKGLPHGLKSLIITLPKKGKLQFCQSLKQIHAEHHLE